MNTFLSNTLYLMILIFLISSCDTQMGLETRNDGTEKRKAEINELKSPDNDDPIVTSTTVREKYLQAFRTSEVYQSFKNKRTRAGNSITPLWTSAVTLASIKYSDQQVLAIPLVAENGKSSQFLYIHVIDGLKVTEGNKLTVRDSAYFRKTKADIVENSTGTVLIPILLSVESRYDNSSNLLYHEAEIKSLHTETTLLKSRKLPNGNIIDLTGAHHKMLAVDCENFLDCVTSTLGQFFEDMGYIYQLIAEGSCYACFSTGSSIQCQICAGVAGIPLVEFSIICAIDEDLGLCN